MQQKEDEGKSGQNVEWRKRPDYKTVKNWWTKHLLCLSF